MAAMTAKRETLRATPYIWRRIDFGGINNRQPSHDPAYDLMSFPALPQASNSVGITAPFWGISPRAIAGPYPSSTYTTGI